jgi:hypothetical protein
MPAVNIAPYIRNQYFNDSGVPLSGGLLNCYEAGSSTRKNTYSDAGGTTSNTNPVVLDAAGRAPIYMTSGAYKFVLTTSAGVIIWTEDNVSVSSITTSVNTVTEMAALVGGSASTIRTLGRLTVNDGGGWWYYWNATSSASDDGGMVIRPSSAPALGRWIGFIPNDKMLNVKVYAAVCDGVTDDISKLVSCNAWCTANSCTILIDSNIYVSTDPALTTKIKLLPSAQFRYGNFNPTLDVVIDGNDKTQHFNCVIAYIPLLNVTELCSEWFGEVWNSSHLITNAVIASINNRFHYLNKFIVGTYEAGEINGTGITVGGTLSGDTLMVAHNATIGGILRTATFTPSPSTAGDPGMICWDSNYLYVCVADATWKRVAIATWP